MFNALRLLLPGLILALLIVPTTAQDDALTLVVDGDEVTDTQTTPVQYALVLEAAQPIVITALAPEFDIVLEVYSPGGVLVASDDDSGGGVADNASDAQLIYNPIADGVYQVVVRQVGSDAPAGDFTLLAETIDIQDPYLIEDVSFGAVTVDPELASRIQTTFTAVGGEVLTIEAESQFQDVVLFLYDSSGTLIARDDDSGLRLNAAILRQPLPDAGDYIIAVEGYNGTLLTDSVTLTVTRTTALRLSQEESHTLSLNVTRSVDRLVMDVEKGDTALITLSASRLLTAPLTLTIYENGMAIPATEMTFSGASQASLLYTASNAGEAEIYIAYDVFLDESLSLTVSMEAQE